MSTIIQELEREQIEKLTANRETPAFKAGDTVRVHVRVVEGQRTRLQAFEGVCIGRRNAGLNSSFTVRKISFGEGVERVFPLYGPTIEKIEVVRVGKVRRAKLYYLRDRRGRSARIAEDTNAAQKARAAAAEAQREQSRQAKADKEAAEAETETGTGDDREA